MYVCTKMQAETIHTHTEREREECTHTHTETIHTYTQRERSTYTYIHRRIDSTGRKIGR